MRNFCARQRTPVLRRARPRLGQLESRRCSFQALEFREPGPQPAEAVEDGRDGGDSEPDRYAGVVREDQREPDAEEADDHSNAQRLGGAAAELAARRRACTDCSMPSMFAHGFREAVSVTQ